MERILNLAGKNSGEIFQLRYPYSLLTFCDYDLSYFAENAIAACDEALRSGELDFDRVTELRNSLKNMHIYIEHNLRTVYEKIVLDCWIDFVCRRDNIGTSALWNRFIDCKTAFEKAVFVRLCEYRYNKGINEWLNLVRVQDYAKNKVYFLFSRELSGVDEANARRNYFDLMFSVTARELGCRLEDLGVTQVFSAGRIPSAPFMYPNISKDIIKNLLSDFDYSDDYSDIGSYEALADQIAMDAFSHMKPGLSQELGSYNVSRPAMEHAPKRVYMPCGLKAVVDLEIDALLESGGWLARCKRCGRYYVRDSEYTEEYCSLPNPNGRTCLELYELEHPQLRVTPEMEKQCDEITDEMYSRVTSGSMSVKEYEGWKLYLEAMKEKVNNGEIQPDDLSSFISYSKTMDISRSNPVVEVRKKEPERPQERVVKPFVPERISRSDLEKKPAEAVKEPEAAPVQTKQRREGFFTSPSVERQKSQGRGTVSHIIRGGEPRGAEPQPFNRPLSRQEEYVKAPERGFVGFGGEEFRTAEQERAAAPSRQPEYRRAEPAPERGFVGFGGEEFGTAEPERTAAPSRQPEYRRAEPAPERGFVGFGGEEFRTAEPERAAAPSRQPEYRRTEQSPERGFVGFGGEEFRTAEPERAAAPSRQPEYRRTEQSPERGFAGFGGEEFHTAEPERTAAPSRQPEYRRTEQSSERGFVGFGDDEFGGTEPEPEWAKPDEKPSDKAEEQERDTAPRPKVIRKNAAAISAYGKIAGTPLAALDKPDSGFEAVSRPEEATKDTPAKSAGAQAVQPDNPDQPEEIDPFMGLESIFDLLDQSESDMSQPLSGFLDDTEAQEKPRKKRSPAHRAKDEPKPSEPPQEEKPVSHSGSKKRSAQDSSPVSPQEAPAGIWTEDRNLYPKERSGIDTHEELDMLKEKKRGRSSKTQRLFDAIMKEPDDNPNFRKK